MGTGYWISWVREIYERAWLNKCSREKGNKILPGPANLTRPKEKWERGEIVGLIIRKKKKIETIETFIDKIAFDLWLS